MQNIEQIIKKLEWRYATKSFESSKKIDSTIKDGLLKVFQLTPTSLGMQMLKIQFIEDLNTRKKLFPFAFNQAQIIDSSALILISVKNEFCKEDLEKHLQLISKTRDIDIRNLEDFRNMIIDFTANKSKEEITFWLEKQAYIALGQLTTVCALLDLDSCPMEGFQKNMFDKILGYDKQGYHTVLALPIGKRNKDDKYQHLKKVRKPLEEILMK